MNFSRIVAAVAIVLVAPLVTLGGTTSIAQAVPGAGFEASARIAPGVRMVTAGRSCTANFVFTDAKRNLYVGYAARCAAKRATARPNGCKVATVPLGTRVRFTGVSASGKAVLIGRGRLAYSSWTAMKRAKSAGTRCATNDFALVKVDRAARRKVSPTVPQWGGPVALAALPRAGSQVFGYAAASPAGYFQPAVAPTMGSMLRSSAWAGTVGIGAPVALRAVGGGYLDSRGRAVGVLSRRGTDSASGSGTVGSLAAQVAFARSHGVKGLRLVKGHAFGVGAVL